MKITEIFDVQNSDNNLILGQNTFILLEDYEDYNNRLHDHSTTLESLTQRALNLRLFKSVPQKFKIAKPSNLTKNEKLKQVQKTKIHGVTSGELMVIKKLLTINLRSFKIMEKLFRENKELQILLKDSRVFAKKQKQKIEYVQNENENLKKTETHLKKRLESFLRHINRASKSFIAGFKDDYDDNCNSEVSLNNDKSNSQKLELAFNLSTNVAYRLHHDANKFMKINKVSQELSFSYDLDVALPHLKIRLTPEIVELPSINFLNSFDRQIRYPLLTWQTKKSFEDHEDESDSKESHAKVKECPYKIEKDVQNAIRLHSVNSSVWKSFLLMKTIKEFVIFNQVCELIKAFMIAGEACEEICSETSHTTFVQSENVNPDSFASENTSECTSQSSLDELTDESSFRPLNELTDETSFRSLNELTDETPDEKIERHTKKRYPKIKVFYSLKKIHKKFINGASNNKKSRIRIPEEQSSSTKIKSISIGVGDSYIMSVDQESQVDNDVFVELTFETECNQSNVNSINDEVEEKDSNTKILTSSRKDFRKSLKSLEDVIRSCQLKSDEERTTTQRDKLRKKQFNDEVKNRERQRKADAKVKEVKKKKRSLFDSYYKKENRNVSELPEMRKMYQVILENRLSQGVSFEYSTPDKSKVQLLFISKSPDAKML